MALWLVRAGSRGEWEDFALSTGVAVIGWPELPDMTRVQSPAELREMLARTYPDRKQKTLINWQSQIWPFIHEISVGDLVALPLKRRSNLVALGEVTGKYKYDAAGPVGANHQLSVAWKREALRSDFNQLQRWTLGAFMTVCRLQREGIEQRVTSLIESPSATAAPSVETSLTGDAAPIDIEEYATQEIREFVASRFHGHELERLVEAVLVAKGYVVQRTQRGADGGVDLVAGSGPMGFDPPRIAVQVKSGDSPVDISVLRELQGVKKQFGADHALIVAWGGYRGSFNKESMQCFFEVRVWTGDDLLRELTAVYDHLPEEFRAELPLKRVFALVKDED